MVLGICFCCLLFLDVFNSYCLISLWGWLSSIMNFDLKAIYRNNFKPRKMLFFSRCLLLPDAWEIYSLSSFKFNYSSIRFWEGGLWNSLKLISSSHGSMLTSCLFYSKDKSLSPSLSVYPGHQFFSLFSYKFINISTCTSGPLFRTGKNELPRPNFCMCISVLSQI